MTGVGSISALGRWCQCDLPSRFVIARLSRKQHGRLLDAGACTPSIEFSKALESSHDRSIVFVLCTLDVLIYDTILNLQPLAAPTLKNDMVVCGVPALSVRGSSHDSLCR